MQSATSLALLLLLLLLLLPPHTFPAHTAASARQLLPIFSPLLLLLLWGYLSLSIFPRVSLSVNLSSSGVESLTANLRLLPSHQVEEDGQE